MTYILTFYHLTYILTFFSGIYSDMSSIILSYLTHILTFIWHSIRHSIWHSVRVWGAPESWGARHRVVVLWGWQRSRRGGVCVQVCLAGVCVYVGCVREVLLKIKKSKDPHLAGGEKGGTM